MLRRRMNCRVWSPWREIVGMPGVETALGQGSGQANKVAAMTAQSSPTLSMKQVLLCGAMIVTLSMGIRHGFGLWLQPITMDRGWSRETFAFAIAVQNLAWGAAGPIAGALADRFGAFKVLIVGSLFYAAGLVLMGLATAGLAFTGSAGVLLGMAQ